MTAQSPRESLAAVRAYLEWDHVPDHYADEYDAAKAALPVLEAAIEESVKRFHDLEALQEELDAAASDLAALRSRAERAEAALERMENALRGLRLDDALEFEGRIEAHAYFSVDALNEARAALREGGG